MFCPKCAKINSDSAEVCSGCGASLKEEVTDEKKAAGKKVWKVVLAVVLIAAVVATVIFLSGCSKPSQNISF